jgi:DNA-binding MarR family transcriptional regulator
MDRSQSALSPSDEAARRVLNCVRQLVRALRLYDREAQAKHGLSAAQMFVLHALAESDGALSLNDVADRTATDQSSASVVVQRLVEAGLVSRNPRKEDRRHVDLKLTTQGRAVTRKTPPPAQRKILEAVGDMSPRDRKAFAGLFEGFVAAVGVKGKQAPMLFEDEQGKSSRKNARKS